MDADDRLAFDAAASSTAPFAPITSVDVRCERSNPSGGALLQAGCTTSTCRSTCTAVRARASPTSRSIPTTADRPVTPGRTPVDRGLNVVSHDVPCPVAISKTRSAGVAPLDPDETYAEVLSPRLKAQERRRTPEPADAEEQT